MDPTNLDSGTWAIVAEFDGPWHAWRVEETHEFDGDATCVMPLTPDRGRLRVPDITQWHTTIGAQGYEAGVKRIHELIDAGVIDQVNLCRILSVPAARVPPAREVSLRLRAVHPAPYSGWFDFAAESGPRMWLVSASPEQAFSVAQEKIRLAPIKGTAPTAGELLEKDYREIALVADALTAEIHGIAPSARVVAAAVVEEHPGMVQLSTRIEGALDGANWGEILATLVPPLSVTGVPRAAATRVIGDLEPSARGPYCGVVGWVDIDTGTAEFGAMIRSFWWEDSRLKFGTGAGITRESDPVGEWEETQFKARTLIHALGEVMAQ